MKEIVRKIGGKKAAVIGGVIILILILLSLIGPSLNEYEYDAVNVVDQHIGPGARYWFGTDILGRDLWTRVFQGTKVSLYVACVAVIIDMTIGIIYGVISGYYGGWLDIILQRILEIVEGIPTVVLVTLLMLIMKPGLTTITIALVFAGWINMSRLVRAQVLKLREMEYVLSAKTMGASDFYIIFREILPNVAGQIVIMAMMSIPQAIFLEAYLSFMGLGIPDPMASLGSLINTGFQSMLLYPYMVLIPVAVFVALVVSFNLIADGLRDILDKGTEDTVS